MSCFRKKIAWLGTKTKPEMQFPRLNSTHDGIYFGTVGSSLIRHPWQTPRNVRFVITEGEKLKNEHSKATFDVNIIAHYALFVKDASRRL